MKSLISFLLFVPTITGILPRYPTGLYIWNVGQGSWATQVTNSSCLHFDMGGEKSPLQRIAQLCEHRKNILLLSHWDWDHVSFAFSFQRLQPNLCLWQRPRLAPKSSVRKKLLAKKIPDCTATRLQNVTKLYNGNPHAKVHQQNAQSLVYFTSDSKTLFPGDSTRTEEKDWLHTKARAARILVLGHHGSLTSTSDKLLNKLPHLKTAIASARFKRYGHPHHKVVQRLKKRKIGLLKTEVWGNFVFLDR